MYNNYEEEFRRWEREGGRFLLLDGLIDTNDLEEVKKFKRKIGREEIEKIDSEYKPRSFNIIKLNERSVNMMFENYELEDLASEFLDEEIDENFQKAIKILPEKLREALGEAYKILIEYKPTLEEIPELLSAVQMLAQMATGKPGKEPYPYPYPGGKVKKSSEPVSFETVQRMLFGGIDQVGLEKSEIPKPTREDPFPSISKSIEEKADRIEQVEEELEGDSDYDEDE